jgi:type IV pilus biogenesis protein CpaD/CtpE
MTPLRWNRLVTAFAAAAALSACAAYPAPSPAAANACPPWAYFPADHHANAASPYLGCTNRENLRAMAARPADLAAGRMLGPADGERAALGIRVYEEGKIKPFSSDNAMGPSIVLPGGSGGGQ